MRCTRLADSIDGTCDHATVTTNMKLPREYSVFLPIRRGMQGRSVRLVQEWLHLHDHCVAIDGDYGAATEAMVRKFQTSAKLHPTGVIDEDTMASLLRPILTATRQLSTTAETYAQRVLAAARQHLRQQPRSIGHNQGPWVRLYLQGLETASDHWNVAFVSYMLDHADENIPPSPRRLPNTMDMQVIATDAIAANRFVPGSLVAEDASIRAEIPPGSIFLRRSEGSSDAWSHCGVVTAFMSEYVETIEVSLHDGTSANGSNVCRRFRSYSNLDFVRM
ncbi:MAG: peptidoglycan-binding protein [Candidatus Kapabacteria bacterium]|nr:peptidoglycan-binding protein [Candidatus Kapabacteria bacterium]